MKLAVLITTLCWGNLVSGAHWFVDSQASGANNGTSWENAWQGFDPINWSSISGGDTLFLSGGTDSTVYDDTLKIGAAGTENKHIVITLSDEDGHNGKVIISYGLEFKYSKDYITINGKGKRLIVEQNDKQAIMVYLCSHITLEDIEVRGVGTYSWQHGIGVNYKCQFITITGCYIHGVTGDGININVSDTVAGPYPATWCECYVIKDCIIDSCADDGMQLACSRATVANCRIRYVYPAFGGIDAAGGHPDGIQTGVSRGSFEVCNNVFINCPQAMFLEGTAGVSRIYNNIFYDVPDRLPDQTTNRFISTNKTSADTPADVVVANNVFYNSDWCAVYMPSPGFAPDELVFDNNIFLNCTRWIGGEGYNNNPGLLGNDNILFTTPDSPVPLQAIPTAGWHTDPLFTGYKGHDFTLQEESPARYNGTNLSEYFSLDFNKTGRPADGAWDIGPYQYSSSGVMSASVPEGIPADYRPVAEYYTITGQRISPEHRVPAGIYFAPDAITGQLRTAIIMK